MLAKLRPPPSLLAILLSLVIWEVFCRVSNIEEYILPSPSVIFKALLEVETDTWLLHIWETLRIALLGFLFSLIVSFILSIFMTYSRRLRECVFPLLVIIQSTPIVAIAPLLIVILGTDDAPRIAIVFLITFFPIVVSTTTGLTNTPDEFLELSKSLRGSLFRELMQIRLPYAIPHIFSGLRIAVTLAVVGTVVAEFVAAENGLGYFIQFSTSFFSIPKAFAGLLILLIISLALFYLIALLQRTFFSWSLNQKD